MLNFIAKLKSCPCLGATRRAPSPPKEEGGTMTPEALAHYAEARREFRVWTVCSPRRTGRIGFQPNTGYTAGLQTVAAFDWISPDPRVNFLDPRLLEYERCDSHARSRSGRRSKGGRGIAAA